MEADLTHSFLAVANLDNPRPWVRRVVGFQRDRNNTELSMTTLGTSLIQTEYPGELSGRMDRISSSLYHTNEKNEEVPWWTSKSTSEQVPAPKPALMSICFRTPLGRLRVETSFEISFELRKWKVSMTRGLCIWFNGAPPLFYTVPALHRPNICPAYAHPISP